MNFYLRFWEFENKKNNIKFYKLILSLIKMVKDKGEEKKDKERKKGEEKNSEKSSKGKEVCETFEVEGKSGKEKIIKTCGVEPKKHASKKQIQEQNKLLRNILIIIGMLFLIVIGTYLIVSEMRYFDYEGIKFEVINSGEIAFYHTSFKMYNEEGRHDMNYNIYLRNSPVKLGETVAFEGDLDLQKMMVIDSTEEFKCEGDGIISVANLIQILGALDTTVVQDPNATCDEQGRYMYVLMQEGEETKIEQVSSSCYNLYINDCEILEVTERFTLEALIQKLN